MMATINVSRNYPRYQSRTSTGGVSCQKWQFLYFYGHHQKQFLCTHDLTGIQDQCHWTMNCFPLRKSLMRNMWQRTRWFKMTLVSTDQGTAKSCRIICALIVNIYASSVQSREGKGNWTITGGCE